MQLGLDIYRASQGERGLQAEAASERRLAAAAEAQAKREESAVAGIEHDVKQRQEVRQRRANWHLPSVLTLVLGFVAE